MRMAYLPPITFILLLVTIFWMWRSYVHPPALVGEVEAVRADVISTVAGTVMELKVGNLQPVTNGQELAVVSIIEPEVQQAELKAIAADLELMKARMAVDTSRNAQTYEQMRLQLLSDKVQLVIDQTNLNQAEIEFNRAEQLFNSKTLISEQAFDAAKARRDTLRVTVSARTALVADKEKTLAALDALQIPQTDTAISAAMQAQQDRSTQLQKPLVLKAPIDGFVSAINKRPGERITAGLPILVVSGNRADRIIGWVRQPVLVKPFLGDLVEVRTIRSGTHTSQATVTAVGEQLEPISPAALPFSAPARQIEYGLQFLLNVPPGNDLIPGEMVQLILGAKSPRQASN
jgi:multidrug resistance efflux pump